MVSYSPVTPINLPKAAIYELAEKLAVNLKFSPATPLEKMVGTFGGKLTHQNIFEVQDSNDGSILIDEDGSFEIFVPEYVSPQRNRFTVAHEIGHYVMHCLLAGKKGQLLKAARFTAGEPNRAEWEANWFAASFLMPEKAFQTALKSANFDYVAVARQFGVSVPAVKHHATYHGEKTKKSK